jgi:hypothetical protein
MNIETVYVSRRPGVYVAIRFVASILTLAQSSKRRSIEVTSLPFVSRVVLCPARQKIEAESVGHSAGRRDAIAH